MATSSLVLDDSSHVWHSFLGVTSESSSDCRNLLANGPKQGISSSPLALSLKRTGGITGPGAGKAESKDRPASCIVCWAAQPARLSISPPAPSTASRVPSGAATRPCVAPTLCPAKEARRPSSPPSRPDVFPTTTSAYDARRLGHLAKRWPLSPQREQALGAIQEAAEWPLAPQKRHLSPTQSSRLCP